MATPDDIESRLSAVERELAELRAQPRMGSTDASAARTLAAGADRDVSEVRAELRAHTSALNALRETQLGMDGRLSGVEGRLGSLERTTTDGFATVGAGMAQIVTLLEGLQGRRDT